MYDEDDDDNDDEYTYFFRNCSGCRLWEVGEPGAPKGDRCAATTGCLSS